MCSATDRSTDLTVHVSGMVETQDTGGVLKGTVERFPPTFFLRPTQLTEAERRDASTLSRQLLEEAGGNTLDFLHALMMQVGDHLTFDTDPTQTSERRATKPSSSKRGVCQDFAHIFSACARGRRRPRPLRLRAFLPHRRQASPTGAGHAWTEAFVPKLGWVGFDPANAICTTDAHARVAIGLDYLGAAPVRGTYYGGGGETLSVAVKVDQAGRQSQS